MAIATGTATSALDYYNKLLAFLTADPALVALGQAWTVAWTAPPLAANPTDRVLRGPGLSATDNVYVGLRLYQDVAADRFWIEIVGMTGTIPTGLTYRDHVNVQPECVRMFLDVGAMTYWFSANGRRFIAVAKISTVYEAMYAGLVLPYAPPTAYAVPLYIGASASDVNVFGPVDWRSVNVAHAHFPWAHFGGAGGWGSKPGAYLLDPMGVWKTCTGNDNDLYGDCVQHPQRSDGDHFNVEAAGRQYAPQVLQGRLMEPYGGTRVLTPISILQRVSNDQCYGILDGCYRVQGFSTAVEDVIVSGGKNHIVLQNVYRTGLADYWAFEAS